MALPSQQLVFTEVKEKCSFVKTMYFIATEAKQKGLNLSSECSDLDTEKINKLEKPAFLKLLEKVEPKLQTMEEEQELIYKQFGEVDTVDNIRKLAYAHFCRYCLEMVDTKDNVKRFILEVAKLLNRKGLSTVTDYLKELDVGHKGWITMDQFDRMMATFHLSMSQKDSNLVFMVLNEFETDSKVSYEQFERVYKKEIQSVPSNEIVIETAKAVDSEKGIKEQSKFLLNLKQCLEKKKCGTARTYFSQTGVVENSKISKENFELGIRKLNPSSSYVDLEVLYNYLKQEDGTVLIDGTDHCIAQALKYESIEEDKHFTEIVQKNNVLMEALRALGKYATENSMLIRNWFRGMDDTGSGKLVWPVFESCLNANKALLTPVEKDAFQSVYKDPTSSVGQPLIDYLRMEKDISNVFTPYNELLGVVQTPKKTPLQLLTEIVRIISDKSDFHEYARSIDRTKKGYLNKGDLVVAFKQFEDKIPLTEDEFEEIYLILNPNKSLKIYMSRFVDSLITPSRHLMVEYTGLILNGFDAKKENPFGYKAIQSPKMKRGWLPIEALTEILQSYDSSITQNQVSLIITCLELTPNNMAIKYRDFSKTYLTAMEKMDLRPLIVIQKFFSKNPSSVFLEEHVFGTEASPDGAAPQPSPEVFTKIKEEVRESVKTLKTNLGMLTSEDAKEIFTRIDTDNSNSISQQELFALVNRRAPEIPPKIVREIYQLLDKDKSGNVSREQFLEVMTKEIPEVHGRLELLIEKTRWASKIYKRIGDKLFAQSSPLSELLFSNEATLQQVVDCFKHTLELKDPEIAFYRLLTPFVQEAKNNMIDAEELQSVIEEYKPAAVSSDKTDLSKIQPAHQPNPLDALILKIRNKIKTEPELSVSLMAKQIDSNQDNIVSIRELARFLLGIEPGITKPEIKQIYKKIDVKGFQLISKDETLEFFGMDKLYKDPSIRQVAVNQGRSKDYEDILRDTATAVYKKKMSLEDFFDFKSPMTSKISFMKVMDFLEIRPTNYRNWDAFIKAIEHKEDPKRVDMTKLKLLFEDYNKGGAGSTPVRPEEVTTKTEALLFDLLMQFENQPHLVSSAFDPDSNGLIELSEFNIFSKKFLSHSMSLDDIKAIYNSLKEPTERQLSTMDFKLALHKIVQKYNQTPEVKEVPGYDVIESYSPSKGQQKFLIAKEEAGTESAPGAQNLATASPSSLGHIKAAEVLTPEEQAQKELEKLYVKIRRAINYKDEELVKKMKDLDKAETCKVHPDYLFDGLKEMNCELSQQEKDTILANVAKSEEQILYLDFVSKVFPQKHLVNIKNAKELADELTKGMKLHKKTFKSLWQEAKGDSNEDFITLTKFSTFLKNRNLLIGNESTRDIFKELDISRMMKVNQEEFKRPFVEGRQLKTDRELQTSLKNFLADILKKTPEETFKPYIVGSGVDYPHFVKALGEIHFPISYLEIETLFDSIDSDNSGTLNIEELGKKLDLIPAPAPVEEKKFDEKILRKAMFKQMKKDGLSFPQFFELLDPENKGFINMKDFIEMTKWLKFEDLDVEKDIRPIFEKIDSINTNYQITCEELKLFYDESTILFLFPHILDFKIILLRNLTEKKLPVIFYCRKHDLNGDGMLDLEEFKALLKDLQIDLKEEELKTLFNELDDTKDGKINPVELRDGLTNSQIDVVEISNKIRSTLIRSNHQASNSFNAAAKTEAGKLSFSEFYTLMTETLGFHLTIIEAEELYDFGAVLDKNWLMKMDFLSLFDGFKPINPFVFNKRYIDELMPKHRSYYYSKYSFMNDQSPSKVGQKVYNQALYDTVRDDMIVSPQKFSFIKATPVDAQQSLPPAANMNAQPNPAEQTLLNKRIEDMTSHITEIDRKLVTKIDLWRRDEVEIKDFFQIYTKSQTDYLTVEELDRMLPDIKCKLSPEEKLKVFSNMTPSADGTVHFLEFKKYYDLVHLKYDRTKFNPRVMLMAFQDKISQHMVNKAQEIEEVVHGLKALSEPGLSTTSFLSLCQHIGMEGMGSTDDSDPLFKTINRRGDAYITVEDLKGTLVDYETTKNKIVQMKDESLTRQVQMECINKGAHNVTNYFTSHDLQNKGNVDVQDFRKFFVINMQFKEDSWEVNRLCQMFATPSQTKIDYVVFLEKFKIVDATTLLEMKQKQEAQKKQSPMIEFCSYVNRHCEAKQTVVFFHLRDQIYSLILTTRGKSEKFSFQISKRSSKMLILTQFTGLKKLKSSST